MPFRPLGLLLLTTVSAAAVAQAPLSLPKGGALIVLSKGDQTLSVVDPTTLKVIGKAPSGPDPHEVVTSADGRLAYISNYNGGGNIISVVDLTSMQALAPIDLGVLRAPHGLAFASGRLWFTAEPARAIGSVDPSTSTVDWVLGTGQDGTHMIHVAGDLSRIITTNIASATVTIFERSAGRRGGAGRQGTPAPGRGETPAGRSTQAGGGRSGAPAALQGNWDATVIPVGRGVEGFDVSPDGTRIWTANAEDGTISIIDTTAQKVIATLAANVNGANRLKFTPDGTRALVSTLGGSDLTIFDVASQRELKRLGIGRAAGIQMQPDGRLAYVASTPDNYVAVIDLQTLDVAGRIDAGRQPDGLAWVRR